MFSKWDDFKKKYGGDLVSEETWNPTPELLYTLKLAFGELLSYAPIANASIDQRLQVNSGNPLGRIVGLRPFAKYVTHVTGISITVLWEGKSDILEIISKNEFFERPAFSHTSDPEGNRHFIFMFDDLKRGVDVTLLYAKNKLIDNPEKPGRIEFNISLGGDAKKGDLLTREINHLHMGIMFE